MLRFRLYFDKDAETDWLNEMSGKGYAMTGFCAGFYYFDACEPGKYNYQVDFGRGFFSVTQDYREFMTEMGVEIVQAWGPWIFVRREAAEGPFELYTDLDSEIAHYSRIRKVFCKVLVIELLCFVMELVAVAGGFRPGILFLCILVGFITAISNIVLKLDDTLAELKERKGEPVKSKAGRRFSSLIPAGLLINSCVLLYPWEMSEHGLKWTLQLLAFILELAGLFLTLRRRGGGGRCSRDGF